METLTEEGQHILIRTWWELIRRLNNFDMQDQSPNVLWNIWTEVVQDVVDYYRRSSLHTPHDQNRYGSYESYPRDVVRLNQNYNAYNEYRPAAEYTPEYNPPIMTRQRALPYDQFPREVWRHTSQVPIFRPRESNPLKRRRNRSHLEDIFRPNHDEEEDCNNGRPERKRNRYADEDRNLRHVPRQDNRKANSIEDREGGKRFCDKRLKIERNDLAREKPVSNATKIEPNDLTKEKSVRSATKDNEQSTVDKNNSKSSIPSKRVDKSSTDVQPTKKSDKSAMTLNDTPSNDIFKDIITTKSYLTDYCSDKDSSCDFASNLSVVDMDISSQGSSPKRIKIGESCVDHEKQTPEKNNLTKMKEAKKSESSEDKLKNTAIIKESKEIQNTPERNNLMKKTEKVKKGSSEDKIKNVDNKKGSQESQNTPEKNRETKKSEEVKKSVLSDNKLKNTANTGIACDKNQETKSPKQNFEFERKIVEGDNKVDMLYKRNPTESNASLSYRITPGYTIPKKAQLPQPSRKKLFSDINDVYSTETRKLFEDPTCISKSTEDVSRRRNDVKISFDKDKPQTISISGNHRLHPDSSKTGSIHEQSRYSPYTSKSENNAVGWITNSKISNLRRNLDQSRSPTNSSGIETSVPVKSPRSENSVPKKISFRIYSNRRQSLESSRSPPSPFRSPVDTSTSSDSSSKSTNCNRPDTSSKSVNRRETADKRSNRTQSLDTSQNVNSHRKLFKNSNPPRRDHVRYDSHSSLKLDSFDSKTENGTRRYYYTVHPDNCKAKPSITRPADDPCNMKRKEGSSDKSIRTADRYVSLSDNSRDAEYDSSSQDSSHSAKGREIISSKHSGSELSDETTDSSRDSGYQKEEQSKSKNVRSSRKRPSDSEITKLKQISVEGKCTSESKSIDSKRNSLDSKVERSKFKRNMNNPSGTSTPVRKKEKRDKRSSAAIVLNDTRQQTSSEVERQNKTNNVKCKETVESEGRRESESGQSNGSELTSKKGISDTAELIVIIEKASTSSLDDSTVKRATFDLSYSDQIFSDKENSVTDVRSDINEKVPSTLDIIDSNNVNNDSISDAINQKCDERYSVSDDDLPYRTANEVASQISLAKNLSIVDPLEEAVKSIVNGNVVSEEMFASLRKISSSNNDDELKGSSSKLQDTSIPLNQDSVEKASGTCPDDSNIAAMKEKSEMCVNNTGKLIDGNNTVLIEAEQKSEINSPEATKMPLDIKSHIVSSTSHCMYTEEDFRIIEQLFDGKNTVLVSASEVNTQVVESKMCDAEVFTVKICKPLSVKIHEVSFTCFEAGRCSPLPGFTFELENARSSLIESPDYGTATILNPAKIIESSVYVFNKIDLKEQDIPIIDLVDDKPGVPIIDLTEETDLKKEEQIDTASNIYELLNKATGISDQITLYRSDETVNDSLDVQATSVSISPPKSGSYEVKHESEIDDEVKKEMDEESEEPDSIFTEIELLNISRKVARPEEVKMEDVEVVHIKDELDSSIPKKDIDVVGTVNHSSENAEINPTETLEKEKEPQNAVAECENLSVQNVTAVLPTDSEMLGSKSTCSSDHTSGNDSAVIQVATAPNMPELNCQDELSNQDCVTASNIAEDRHGKPIQEKVVEAKSVQAEIVDALHEIDQMIEREEDSQARSKSLPSQPNASIAGSGNESSLSANQSLNIRSSTTKATILQNEVLRPSVVSQPTISSQTSCEASTSYGTDNTLQRNIPQADREKQTLQNPPEGDNIDKVSESNVLTAVPDKSCNIPLLQVTQRNNTPQSLRRDGGTETQPPSIIQTQDSQQQKDIWNVTGILVRNLLRIHCLNACCNNYSKTLSLYRLIDPELYRVESNVMPQFHENRLSIYAAEMKANFEQYTFNSTPIPADVLKVTYICAKKVIPFPQLDMKWIIFVLLSLMKKEASYYYAHISLKYLYIYIITANQKLNVLKRQQDQLGQQQQAQQQGQSQQQQQYLAPDQLSALKNQIQQFNNICSTQQQLLNSKPQKDKKTTQRKGASKLSKGAKNTKSSCTNENSQVKTRQSPSSYAQTTSSRLQDSNNSSTKIASSINPKILKQLLQATPPAPSSVQSSPPLASDIMSSPTNTMSVYNPSPNMSPAHVSTPMIRLKDPSSLMQDTPKASQTNANMSSLERMLDKFPCDNASNSTRKNISAGNSNCLGCTPRSIHMTPILGTVSSPMHQLSSPTGIIDGRNAQEHVYAPLPNPAYMSSVHSTVPSQSVQSNVPTSSARQHGVTSAAQQLSNLARTIHTTSASSGGSLAYYSSPHHQTSNVPVTNESGKPHLYLQRTFRPPPAYVSPSHSISSSQGVPSSSARQCSAMSSPTRDMGRTNSSRLPTSSSSYMSLAHMSSPAHRPLDRTESTSRMVYAPTVNIPCAENRVSNPNLHSVGMSPAHNYVMSSPAHPMSDKTESTGRMASASIALSNMSSAQNGVPNQNLYSMGISPAHISAMSSPAHISAMSSPAHRTSEKTDLTSRVVSGSTTLPNVPVHMTRSRSGGSNQNIESLGMSPAHISAMSSPAQQRFDKAGSRSVYYNEQIQNLLGHMSPAQSAALNQNFDPMAVSPVYSSGVSETMDQTGSIAAAISQKLSALTSRQTVPVRTTSSSILTPRISPISSNKSLLSDTIVRSPAHQSGTTPTSGQTACVGSGFLGSPNQSTPSARTCPVTSLANNGQLAQLETGGTPLGVNTPASIRIHLDDDEGSGVTPVYAPMLFSRRYDQLSTSTSSPSPVSHISDDVEVIDLTWIDDLDEERLEMEVDEMVKKEELEDDEEVIINNIDHFAVINDSQKYPPE